MPLFLNKQKIRCLFFLAVALPCFYVSYSLFQMISGAESNEQYIPSSKHANTIKAQGLVKEAEELREQYQVVVFKGVRKKIGKKLERNLKKQINQQPFNSKLWRELTFLQASNFSLNKQAGASERQWVFLVAKQLLQWNSLERSVLLKRCVYFSLDTQVDVKRDCAEIFTNTLKVESLDSLARKLDLKKESIQSAMSTFGVKLSKEGKK